MREYIYLWIHKYVLLGYDGQDKKHYLFENIGVPLSSRYNIEDCFEEESKKLTINIEKRKTNDNYFSGNYFSENIIDLVAIVGNNGSGKSSIFRLLKSILTDGEGNTADDIGYLLLYIDEQTIKGKSTLEKEGIEVNVSPSLNENETNDCYGSYRSEDHKSDYVIFYSPFFNVSKGLLGNYHGSHNISTEHVIGSYKEKLYNLGMDEHRFFDRLDSYSYYEQQIELDFLADFLKNEEKLPMDLPTYMHIQSNDGVIILLKKTLSKDNEKLLRIVEKWENSIGSLEDKIYLSVFACIYRSYSSSSFSPFLSVFDGITENISIKEALDKVELEIANIKSKTNIEPKITYELKKMIDLIVENSKKQSFELRYLLFIKSKKEELKQIMNLHYDIRRKHSLITPFLLFERQRLSSGEDNLIQLFARFYHIWKDSFIYKGQILEVKDVTFLIDEGEANFHPEWQRQYIKMIIDWIELIMEKLKSNGIIVSIPKFQIFLSTHSPFVACDLPKNNMICLKLKEKTNKDDFKSVRIVDFSKKENIGIGTSIVDLLKNDFFIDNTVGVLAAERIEKMVKEIRRNGYENISPESKFVLDNLGDKFIKSFLKEGNKNDENTNNTR
jgi:energy-coupling factor transporter ATP-binding protein EcfA2